MPQQPHRIALLGSTGSIGEQTLDIIRRWPARFEATTLASHNNWQRLAAQAVEFMPDSVVIANKEHYATLKEALAAHPIKVYAGSDALAQIVAGGNIDTVVNAIVGYAGLDPTIETLRAGKKLALANKESLVVAGDLLIKLAAENRAPIIPIDSEHSAIFQCLAGEVSPISRIILTASGGPFIEIPAAELETVTVEQALRHPNWSMGPKITVDSATLVNKGLEVIEARWLFGVPASRIEVKIHPQSVVHSMVEFADGSIKAQLGTPDMHLPIQYALTFPQRWEIPGKKFNFADCGALTFTEPDHARFPALGLAFGALERGGNAGCTLNAANEVAVAAFLAGRIGFTHIARVIAHTLEKATFMPSPTFADYQEGNAEAQRIAQEYIDNE